MAIKSSFKQQCPSCEAMVPIRDPKLIGRKIDCPKCKYRFIVEEPVDDVEEAEEEPVKKKKSGSAAITTKKPLNGKAGKPTTKRRPDDDEDEDEAPPKKKKSGGSGMLIAGIGLAVVAVIALAVGAFFLLTGSDSDSKPSSGPSANVAPPPSGTGGDAGKAKDPTPPVVAKPKQEDVTNLLPNDTQVVLNLPLEHLLANAKVNQALLKTPGGFHEAAFQRVWGISPNDIRRVVQSYNVEKKTIFSVMRTSAKLEEKQIVAGLNLKPVGDSGTLKYYLVTKPLDALSTSLLKGGEHHDKVALHFVDQFTVVCADVGPMNQFLQEKGQPKSLSKLPVEEPQGGGQQGGPPGMQGGPPGMRGGPPGMQGGPRPPGGGPKPAGGPQPAGPPGGGGQPPNPGGAGGGFRPPNGMPRGGPPGMFPGGSGGGISDAAPVSSSYMTIDPQIKAVLDQVEKVDKQEGQNVLLSVALNNTSVGSMEAFLKTILASLGNKLPNIVEDPLFKKGVGIAKEGSKAVGFALTHFNDSTAVGNAAMGVKDAKLAEQLKKVADTYIPVLLLTNELDLVSKNAGRGNFPGMPGGMQGGQPPGGFQPPGQGGFQPPPQRQGGFQPPGQGGIPGMQPPDSGTKEEKGKQGSYLLWTKDNVLAFGVNLNIKAEHYKMAGSVLEYVGIFLRGVSAMSDRHARIHELAAALQVYHDKEGHFPCGAVIRRPDGLHVLGWRPDQRLSWMTRILPYLANGEFKAMRFDPDKAWWEGSTNEKAGFTVIPQFVASIPSDHSNYFYVRYPNLSVDGPGEWAATHFIGVAGVGLDAAEYRDGDPATAKLRGVFGYDRETKKDAIKDGVENTIAVIQVPPEPKSPWIAGGGSTVRGVSDDLDCVRPFVCAKYKNKDGKDEDGTFALMADGKVRFIPATIDPKTFQAMCTIAGGEKIKDIDAIAPEVPPPEDLLQQPELKAEQPAPAAPPPAPQNKSDQGHDLQKLQGAWTLVGGEAEGKAVPANIIQQLAGRFTVNGDTSLLTSTKDKEGTEGKFKLDETKTPKAIEWLVTKGMYKGQTQLGIYTLDGDELKLCVARPNVPRPTTFATKPGDNSLVIFVFKRSKP